MSLNNIQEKIEKTIPQKEVSVEGELLAIHLAADRLWGAYRENEDLNKLEQKLANVFICAFLTATKLGVKNIDEIVEKRIEEIKNAPYKGK